jgi:hypothetical protein
MGSVVLKKEPLKLSSFPINFLLLSLTTFLFSGSEAAGQSRKLFPYGLDVRDATLPRESDDISSPELRLSVPILFHGKLFNSLYVRSIFDISNVLCRIL